MAGGILITSKEQNVYLNPFTSAPSSSSAAAAAAEYTFASARHLYPRPGKGRQAASSVGPDEIAPDQQDSRLTPAYKLINEPASLQDVARPDQGLPGLGQLGTSSGAESAAKPGEEKTKDEISELALISSQVNDLKRLLAAKLEDLHSH